MSREHKKRKLYINPKQNKVMKFKKKHLHYIKEINHFQFKYHLYNKQK
ncbi:unnamed protein product [Paramecium primaurelia]|uniref:Uncharacterized protein n=1 Tax=Paramecium primaurelia TaxID=5886 RepID=A0A8S1NJZ8_PARPR|nr:unnamed protein product [Paramecium primaurelia]